MDDYVGGVTSMDPFLKKFFPEVYEKEHDMKPSDNQYCKFDSQTLTLFTSSLYLAALVASLVASVVTRAFGRRLTMLFGGLLFLFEVTDLTLMIQITHSLLLLLLILTLIL